MFTGLDEIYKLSRAVGVGFSLTFCEANGRWYFTCESPSKDEQSTRTDFASLDIAMEEFKSYLIGLLPSDSK